MPPNFETPTDFTLPKRKKAKKIWKTLTCLTGSVIGFSFEGNSSHLGVSQAAEFGIRGRRNAVIQILMVDFNFIHRTIVGDHLGRCSLDLSTRH